MSEDKLESIDEFITLRDVFRSIEIQNGTTYDTTIINLNLNAVIMIVKRKEVYGDGSSFFPYKLILVNGETLNIKEEEFKRICK